MSKLFVRESPVRMGEDESKVFLLKIDAFDGSTITLTDTDLGEEAYKDASGSDVSGDITTGSASVSGNTLTTKNFTGLSGNSYYIVTQYATINGVKGVVGKFRIDVESNKSE